MLVSRGALEFNWVYRQRFADGRYKPLIRMQGNLAPGKTFNNGDTPYEFHTVGGCARVSVRIKTVTGGGNLDLFFIGPDIDIDRIVKNAVAYSQIASYGEGGTIYSTGGPATVPVTSATEAQIQASCYGEGYVVVRFTANVGGSIAYCDISRV